MTAISSSNLNPAAALIKSGGGAVYPNWEEAFRQAPKRAVQLPDGRIVQVLAASLMPVKEGIWVSGAIPLHQVTFPSVPSVTGGKFSDVRIQQGFGGISTKLLFNANIPPGSPPSVRVEWNNTQSEIELHFDSKNAKSGALQSREFDVDLNREIVRALATAGANSARIQFFENGKKSGAAVDVEYNSLAQPY